MTDASLTLNERMVLKQQARFESLEKELANALAELREQAVIANCLIVKQQRIIANRDATITELRKAGREAASRACSIGQVPSEQYQREHYPIFWGDA